MLHELSHGDGWIEEEGWVGLEGGSEVQRCEQRKLLYGLVLLLRLATSGLV
jgi:hypothetical protein